MDIQINTANNVVGREALNRQLEAAVRQRLSRFSSRLTHVELHVGDEKAAHGAGLRCAVEARPAGLDPVTVTEHAGSIDQAAAGALTKLISALDHTFGKLSDRKGH